MGSTCIQHKYAFRWYTYHNISNLLKCYISFHKIIRELMGWWGIFMGAGEVHRTDMPKSHENLEIFMICLNLVLKSLCSSQNMIIL